MPPKKVAPKKSSAKKAAPKKSSAKKAAPKKSTAKKVVPKKSTKATKSTPKVSTKSSATSSATSFGQWSWGDDHGKFMPFDTRENQILEDAFVEADGTGVVQLSYNGWNYNVDFTGMTQENRTTGRRRPLQREVKKAASESLQKVKETAVKRERMVMKGRGVVDPLSGKVSSCHVYESGNDLYQCTLNQTNTGTNNNKFYILQLLEEDGNTSNQFYLFTRWGRVGVSGQMMTESFVSLSAAISAFKKKFRDKTSNSWDTRDNFVKVPGKYYLMQIDYGSTADEDDDDKKPAAAKKKKLEEEASTLGAGVQGLMKLIGSKEAMNLAMKELEVDTTRMPLGKISKDQIKKAYGCLTAIETELKKKSPNVQEQTDLFYTLIPHDFGFRKPPLINSDAMLKSKIEMLETLSGLEIASKLLDNAEAAQGTTRVKNHLDRTYDSLHCKIEELDEKDPVFDAVKTYVKNTKGATHRLYQLEVEKVFSIEREGESSRYTTHYGKVGNKRMLWHGSRMTNFVGILSNGLRIAPPEAPVTGYMFGKGIYFSDVSSKSANYCNTTRTSNTGLMLLCEVALGEQKEYVQASYVTKLPAPYQSTKGVGQMFPDPKGEITVGGETDVIWPVGKMTKDDEDKRNLALLYPEHIVYDVNQCRMRYLVQLKFKYN